MSKYFLLLWPFIGYFLLDALTPHHYVFENLMFSVIVGIISLTVFLLNCKYFVRFRDNSIKGIILTLSMCILISIKSEIADRGMLTFVYILLIIYPLIHHFLFLRKDDSSEDVKSIRESQFEQSGPTVASAKGRIFALTLLGIAASVGLGSLIASPWRNHRYVCYGHAPASPAPISVCPTPAPKKLETITLVFTCGPDPFPIRLEEPYAHGRKTPLPFKEAVNNYSWIRMIAPLHRCSPGPDSEEVDAYIKKKHRAFYDAAVAEVKRVEAEDADSYKNDGKAKP